MAKRLRPEEMTEPPSDDTPSKRMSSVVNVDFDDILKDIAKALYKNTDIDDLGKALGFGPREIGRKIAENNKRGGNHMGTLDLLRTWQNRQTPSTEKAALRSALLEAGFDNLADQHLSTPVPGDNEAMPSEIMKLREQLKRRYRKTFSEIKTSSVDSESQTWLQHIYVSLVLMLGLEGEKEEPIDYDGLFKFIKTDTPKGFVTRLAFIGEAGVGKSTLFAKIALDWAEGKILQEITPLFLESFQEIKEIQFFGDTVMGHFPDDSEIKGERVDEYMRKNPRKVLILLDGLDEAQIDIKKPNRNDAIVSIVRGERFIDTPVVITTCPFGADQIRSIMMINDHHTFDKTTSYPSLPNTRTSTTTPTTAAAATTISQKAFFVITLLAWVAVTVSGTTPEISSMTGHTVNIPCLFGEGTVRNIFWSYNDGTGRHKILFLADGNLHKEAEYENRASLQGDISTLILKDITVADEGTYRCDVDRQGLTVVTNITTKLNVFSLRPDTFPVISPCTGADKSSSCIIHANQSVTLTCTLPNVYPVEDAKLIWYQDGQRVSSTDNGTQNADGTTDISRQIQVSETGNFTCNATYLSANGKENTVVSVEAWIIPLADVPNTPGKNVERGLFGGLMICMLLILVTTIIRLFWKARGRRCFRRIVSKSKRTQLNQAESCKPSERPTEKCTNYGDVNSSISLSSFTRTYRNVNSPTEESTETFSIQ